MKTQLLEDIGENGSGAGAQNGAQGGSVQSAPGGAPPDKPRPAVWHRTSERQRDGGAGANAQRAAHGGSMQRAPQEPLHTAPLEPPNVPRAGERAAFASSASAAAASAGAFGAGTSPPTTAETAPLTGDPDWLTAHLRRTAAQQPERGAPGSWTRRAFGWSLGLSLLAVVVAAGLWIYEDRRDEGALAVLANTGSPPAPSAMPKKDPAPPASVPAAALPATKLPAASAPPFAGETHAAPAASAAPPDARTVQTVEIAPEKLSPPKEAANAEPAVAAAPPKQHARRTRRAVTAAAPAQERAPAEAAEPSPRQRREEMLMQCRAHGYDERECVQRGCEMTRFGFACPG